MQILKSNPTDGTKNNIETKQQAIKTATLPELDYVCEHYAPPRDNTHLSTKNQNYEKTSVDECPTPVTVIFHEPFVLVLSTNSEIENIKNLVESCFSVILTKPLISESIESIVSKKDCLESP